jgi:hypothetical protein
MFLHWCAGNQSTIWTILNSFLDNRLNLPLEQGIGPVLPRDLNRVVWGQGRFVASGNGYIITSTDGYDWTVVLDDTTLGEPFDDYGNIVSGPGSSSEKWIVASSAVNEVKTSPDGIDWFTRTIPTGSLTNLIWDDTRFISGLPFSTVYTSTDGINWTGANINNPPVGASAFYANGRYMAGGTRLVGSLTRGAVYTTTDYTTGWTLSLTTDSTASIDQIRFGNSQWMVASRSAATSTPPPNGPWRSSSGTGSWVNVQPGTFPEAPSGIDPNFWDRWIWTGQRWILSPRADVLLQTSDNGTTWNLDTSLGDNQYQFTSLASNGTTVVAVGSSGLIAVLPA